MKKVFTVIICIHTIVAQTQKTSNETIRRLQMVEFTTANLYADSVSEDKLVEGTVIKMLAQLDPYSIYNDVEEAKRINESLQGNSGGIDAQLRVIEDTLLVV